MKKIVILYSGGLDSFLLKKYAEAQDDIDDIKCIYYKHGADAEEKEIERLPDFVEVRNVEWLGPKSRAVTKLDDPFAGAIYIPGRNLVFTVLAASQELPDEVWMGVVFDEDNPKATDKNEKFRNETSELLSYVLSPFIKGVRVRFPFVENSWTKESCVNWALNNEVATETEISNTVSCWHQKENRPCGTCKQCFKRWFVFFLNGFSENYVNHPLFSRHGKELMSQYMAAYMAGTSNRDEANVLGMIYRAAKKDNFPKPILDDINKICPEFMKQK